MEYVHGDDGNSRYVLHSGFLHSTSYLIQHQPSEQNNRRLPYSNLANYADTFEGHRKYFRGATKAVSSGIVSTFIFCIILHQAVNEELLLVQIYIDVVMRTPSIFVLIIFMIFFRIPPSPFSQRELHRFPQAPFPSGGH